MSPHVKLATAERPRRQRIRGRFWPFGTFDSGEGAASYGLQGSRAARWHDVVRLCLVAGRADALVQTAGAIGQAERRSAEILPAFRSLRGELKSRVLKGQSAQETKVRLLI